MSVFPVRIQDLLDFADQHAGNWLTNYAGLGISSAQATAFKNATIAGRAAWNAQLAAEDARRVAVANQQAAIRTLRSVGADTVRLIRAFAEVQANPTAVYSLAQIPAPATPSPAGPPGIPDHFKAVLNPDGSVTLRWKCVNPTAGTVYHVRRRLAADPAGQYTPVGSVGIRSFTDTSIPGGAGAVEYTVTGQRAEFVGQTSSPFVVQFGQSGAGLTIVSTTEGGRVTLRKAA